MFPNLRGTFGFKLDKKEDGKPAIAPRIVNYKQKAKNRKARKAKNAQARHMRAA